MKLRGVFGVGGGASLALRASSKSAVALGARSLRLKEAS
jgi:hypothetical protein